MKESILFSVTIVLIYILLFIKSTNLKIVNINGNKILVRDLPNANDKALVLNELIIRMYKLRNYLVDNIKSFQEHRESILLLKKNFNQKRSTIYENDPRSQYTSYCVNKGEEFVFCLTSKKTGKIHHINLLIYVATHEMAHAGCKELGHTPLFNKIFRFYLQEAVKLNLYKFVNYRKTPVNYCGMELYTNILN